VTVQVEKLNRWRLLQIQPEVTGDLSQGVVEVREMIQSHVADEGAADFVVAGAAMKPTNEHGELRERGKCDNDPVRVHEGVKTRELGRVASH
jgi:hypothetical protein